MTDLRQAAEQALEALEHFNQGNSLAVVQGEFDDEIEALRQALHSTKFLPEEMDAYERGFIEGRQDQMRSTVERAVNAMTKREWVGLTDEEMRALKQKSVDDGMTRIVTDFEYIRSIEAKLKDKNSALYTKPEPVDWEAVAADQAMTIAMMQIENKKEWVGLTDAQIYEHEWWDEETAFAVNKELKEKNT